MAVTLAQLLDLLPDNTTGEISAADMRTIVSALWAKSSGSGQVGSDGTLTHGPAGWTGTRLGVGLYQVTHNLNVPEYAVVVTPLIKAVDGMSASVESIEPNSFTFGTYSAIHQALHDTYANFVLAVTP